MKKNKALRKSDILYHIIKGWRMILLCTVIGLIIGVVIIGAGFIRGEVSKEYRVTASIAIVTARKSDKENNSVLGARVLTDTAVYIIKSQKNMEAIVDELKLRGVSADDISRNLSLTRYEETEVVDMTLLWRSEKEGVSIMDALIKVSTGSIKDVIKMGAVTVINEPKANFIVGGNINMSTAIYATVVGFLLGLGICFLRFLLMPTLINEDDVANIFGIDTLGSLPLERQYMTAKPTDKGDLPIYDDIRSVSHLLISHLENARVNKLYITSTCHNEGKTRLLADIAMQFARLGKKTLLIDCDLANPRLGALFFDELEYEQTLNSLYRGDSDKLDAILHINGCLDILPTVLEKNPEDLNDALLVELQRAMEGYDYVMIDAPPVGVEAEALRLNEIVDTALYVVRFDFAKLDDIKRSMLRIAKSGIPVVGAVFNCVVNWRQTVINTPKRLTAALKREEKKRAKQQKKHEAYKEMMEKKEEMNRRPDRRYLDGVAPAGTPLPAPAAEEAESGKKKRREKKQRTKKAKTEAKAENTEPVAEAPQTAEPTAQEPVTAEETPAEKKAEKKAAETKPDKKKAEKKPQKSSDKKAEKQSSDKKNGDKKSGKKKKK